MKKLALYITCLILPFTGLSQKIGLVFSGGGATGFAHIGVLKALEENNIPIDFITGTSAGALVGGLYASGYSPWEIEAIVLSEQFQLMSDGDLEDKYVYYIHQNHEDAELVSFRFAKDSIFQKSLPTNILNPTFMDYEMLNLLAFNSEASKKSFDSLFVPFRCIASDIATKESIMFSGGSLNVAVRASMTYPFFISPIEVDGKLLFDGGLYNNFPAEEMYTEFDPDFIIGSNVSYNEPPPSEDDLMSQVRNMFSVHSDYTLPCESGIIIVPDLGDEVGTFEFDKIERAIQIGYEAALEKIDSIKLYVTRRVTIEERNESRKKFKRQKSKLNVTAINVTGTSQEEKDYIKKKLIRNKAKKKEALDYYEMKKRYLRLYQSEHIQSMYPRVKMNSDSSQEMTINIRKEKPLRFAFGGHYSSRPVNTGFLSASYSDFKITPITIYANAYFGKFYGSVKAGLKLYLPSKTTSYIEPYFVMNRWDYFKSFATFFEDVKPSYIIQNERFWGLDYHIPLSSKTLLSFEFTNGMNEDNYYQTDNFTNLDTTDFTSFLFYSPGVTFQFNTLNRKQFASAGTQFVFKSRFVHGIENTIPGSTSMIQEETQSFWNWVYVKMSFKTFFMKKGLYRLGVSGEALYSIKPFFSNYTATLLSSQAYQPIPDSKTGFYDDFRSDKYLGGGLINIFTLKDKLDLRIEAYLFQAIIRLNDDNGQAVEGELFGNRFAIGSASLIYHSPLGPLRASVNYITGVSQLKPLSFQVSFGYVIFNQRGLK